MGRLKTPLRLLSLVFLLIGMYPQCENVYISFVASFLLPDMSNTK